MWADAANESWKAPERGCSPQPLIRLEQTYRLDEIRPMISAKIPQLKDLSTEEKLILVGELWDDLAAHPEAFPPREDHIKLLQERLENFRKHPEDVVSWEDVKSRILSSR
jgi:putative addiction module component (TIGR02574 family)